MALADRLRGAGTGQTAQNYAQFNAYLRAALGQRRQQPGSVSGRTDRAAPSSGVSAAKVGGSSGSALRGIPDFRVRGLSAGRPGGTGFQTSLGQRNFVADRAREAGVSDTDTRDAFFADQRAYRDDGETELTNLMTAIQARLDDIIDAGA